MVTVAGIKIKSKKQTIRNPLLIDEKYTGTEPEWPEGAEDWADDKFDNRLRKSFYYYNYYYNQKDCRKYVLEWMKASGSFTDKEIKVFARTSDKSTPMTVSSLIMAHRNGMPFRGRHLDFISECIYDAIAKADPDPIEEPVAKFEVFKPTIQDRLNEKTAEVIGELEGMYDAVQNKEKVSVKIYDFLVSNAVPQSQLGKYEKLYSGRKAELEAAQAKTDEQLAEGYKFMKAADFKRMLAFIDEILDAVSQYRGVKKATKAIRKPRAVSKEKQVARLKYLKEEKELKLVSVPPASILGAKELWCYDSKTRKLYCYVADSVTGPLGVKGTTITGYDEAKSIGKTLRKPAEQLKEFAKAGKIALRTFLKDIKATEVRASGRTNANLVLLKVQ